MSAPLAGQDKAPIATVARDYAVANQEVDFPRGRVNHKMFFNEEWQINREQYGEQYLKYPCCNPEKGGHKKSIDCAFKRVYGATSNGVQFIGAPHGGTTGANHARTNGFIARTTSGKR
tara:strand:- start:209 stop:562 length:354 start_codon:yes stop_codon:yes gene_type:complete